MLRDVWDELGLVNRTRVAFQFIVPIYGVLAVTLAIALIVSGRPSTGLPDNAGIAGDFLATGLILVFYISNSVLQKNKLEILVRETENERDRLVHMLYIIEKDPHLKERIDQFTYYELTCIDRRPAKLSWYISIYYFFRRQWELPSLYIFRRHIDTAIAAIALVVLFAMIYIPQGNIDLISSQISKGGLLTAVAVIMVAFAAASLFIRERMFRISETYKRIEETTSGFD